MAAKPTPESAPPGRPDPLSRPPADPQTQAQLSDSEGVHSSVSSVAMDGAVFAMQASAAMPRSQAFQTAEGLTDAEIMLRVKAGDESAFGYLVQKYRRPMVSFLYRMSHNSAAAEDLAQEVFLRVYRSRASYEA